MRITRGFILLLLGLLLVSGCIFHHRKAKSPEPIKFHEVSPAVLTNALNTVAARNGTGWDVATNLPPMTNPIPAIMAPAASPSAPPVPRTTPTPPVDSSKLKMIVTPSTTTTATVSWVDSSAKFVVLTFPIGHLPAENQLMSLYRQGLKVGNVKATGPQKDNNVVADLLDGDAQLGDEVR